MQARAAVPAATPLVRQRASAAALATQEDSPALDRECRVFTRHLIDQEPSSYVLGKYRDAHRQRETFRDDSGRGFDSFLLTVARLHPLAAKLVDTYVSLFLRTSIVRRKTVLLLAILETCAPSYACFEKPDAAGKGMLLLRGVERATTFLVALVVSAALLLPLHLAFTIRSKLLRDVV